MIITINIKFCTINPWDMIITINIKFCTINPLGYDYNNKYKILYYQPPGIWL